MLLFQYGVVDYFPNDLGIDNSAVSSIVFFVGFVCINICPLYVCCRCRNVISVKFPVWVLCDPSLWDLNYFSVMLVLYL